MTIPRRLALYAIPFAFFLAPFAASAATLSAAPGRTSVSVGDTVNVTVTVSSPGEALNAISGTLSFPPHLLSVVSVSRASSILTLWVQEPSYSNAQGTVSWTGLVPNPGWSGYAGTVLVIQFRARATGTADLSFSSSSVLANDGQGTNILTGTAPGSLTVVPAAAPPPPPAAAPSEGEGRETAITSPTHPDESAWYNRSEGIFEWTNPAGVTALRLGYDTDPDGDPAVTYAPPVSRKELELENGTWYFHLQAKSAAGWGPISTYRVQVDTVPPEPLSIAYPDGASAKESIRVRFGTTDRLSGIDRYVLSVDGEERVVDAVQGGGVYELAAHPGSHTLSVTAYDKAGNTASAESTFIIEGASPVPYALLWRMTNYLSAALIALAALALAGYLGWYFWHHFHAFRRRYPGSVAHTHRVVTEQFTELQDALVAEIASLEKVRNRRELTREEARVITNLKKLIKRTQFAVEDEMMKHGK